MYLLTLNCGSSSIKGKLFNIPSKEAPLEAVAKISVLNIGAKGDRVHVVVKWLDGLTEDVDERMGDGGQVEHRHIFPIILKHISSSGSGIAQDDIKYITHRIVHGGLNKRGLRVTKEDSHELEQMDALSRFAPLHNHHAVLCVRACLDAVPNSTQLLYFDTLFHQTLPPEVYTYALPPSNAPLAIPLRKYGFHGLSYSSIVHQLAQHTNTSPEALNLVVAHLGSGASACCIRAGKSIDTTMGLTPLEGLVGGTRTGNIDPTAIMHHTPDYASDAGLHDMHVTRGEWVMNRESGLLALAGTPNFGAITTKAFGVGPENEEKKLMRLAYDVFIDRVMAFVTQYLAKLLAQVPMRSVQLVFSGGIGENAARLRRDVLERLSWLGTTVSDANEARRGGAVRRISGDDSRLAAWVVETDEEGWCAQMAREDMGI
ncbi:uncharacterized protein CcaverHIS019_0604420 [Cutaneotrichosporon cavernicola]|uniref:Probable acetate kinase n=1 Tax=Cutaneotrichosporon cavernicola TaxID=279322 RepID=A0AA48L8M8_9TREE|nr:uncharacterized protein CcaverHIS019_0604420 [Cutaneotrichosporon cavernicola]BEI93983.1 hypothetical protein CcaverHIS019_0604420 [Cutaneotrichosporon cavernicola]BEJ01764.1 hypothetical protein CcaverHIS631_0604460 [Cutaneotrichosporon cavernicola]BEJ09531.1 hypothetical protein CcaverHIS641_0604460 [Cutaneotrichosporon cavernicola]